MMNLNLEDFSIAEPVTDVNLLKQADANHIATLDHIANEINIEAQKGNHPFRQLAKYNDCTWESLASLVVFDATVPTIRLHRMSYEDIERDINFNLMSIWACAEVHHPDKFFFTTHVSYDDTKRLWYIEISLNITEGTDLTKDEMDIRLLRIKTETGKTRIY